MRKVKTWFVSLVHQCRVVVTGMGAVTPLGNNVEEFWQRLCAGESGIGTITLFDATPYQTRIAAEVHNLTLPEQIAPSSLKRIARFALLALVAAIEAWQQSGLHHVGLAQGGSAQHGSAVQTGSALGTTPTCDPYQIGVLIGSTHGGEECLIEGLTHILRGEPRAVSPRMISRMLSNMAAVQIARQFHIHGPSYTLASACASGAQAIGEAAEIIRRGDATVMLCGGAEACITPLTLVGDQASHALSKHNDEPQKACRPFDISRDGFVLGEGAGILILEEYKHAQVRGATIYAELAGYGNTIDAFHETRPEQEGIHLAQAIRQALRKSEIQPSDIDAIFAHATGTIQGDLAECAALTLALGEALSQIPLVALKAALGHALGAAGAIQVIAGIKALVTQTLPPTLNVEQLDPACGDLRIFTKACAHPMRRILSNASGFGGHNVGLVLERCLND
jgi:3-oxoacyl-[acyl-carrier-protein] synthase II